MTDLPDDPVAYAEECEGHAEEAQKFRGQRKLTMMTAPSYAKNFLKWCCTDIPRLATIVREQYAEIQTLRGYLRRIRDGVTLGKKPEDVAEIALEDGDE